MLACGRCKQVSDKIQVFHGFLGVKSDFDLLNRELSEPELIGYDLAGHGKQSGLSEEAFLTTSQVRFWRERLPEDSILLGYSMGGRLALQLACRYPDFLHGLILVGASPGLKTAEEQRERRKWDRKMAERLKIDLRSFLQDWNKLPIISTQKNIDPLHRKKMQESRVQQNPSQLAKSMEIFGTGSMPSCWHLLEKIQIPVLLLIGEQDQKYRKIAQEMDVILPNAQVQIISDAGHCCHLEQPIQTARIIENWIERLA